MTDAPLVSVISPCYNVEKYIGKFLDSVLDQTYPAVQLILIDDCSEDRTCNIAETYRERFDEKHYDLVIIRSKINNGAAAAINRGLPLVKGKYFMWVDADDILYPDNITEKVNYLENHPECGFVLCQQENVSENDLSTALAVWKRNVSEEYDPLIEDLIRGRNVVYGPGTVMVRYSAFRKAIPSGRIYESRQGQNYQLMFPLAYCCKCGYIDKVLFKYVLHSDSHSNSKRSFEESIKRQRDFIDLIDKTLSVIPEIRDDDYKRYMRIAKETLLSAELDQCLKTGHILHYLKTKGEMKKEGLRIGRNHKPFFFYGRSIKRKLKSLTGY